MVELWVVDGLDASSPLEEMPSGVAEYLLSFHVAFSVYLVSPITTLLVIMILS